MEKLINIAKAFIESILIVFSKDNDNEMKINYDPKGYTLFNVVIVNPNNKKRFGCTTLIDNMFVSNQGKVGLWTKYNFLMEVLIDYLYEINEDTSIRKEFASVFSEEDIKLLIDYFSTFPSYRMLSEKYEKG